MERDRRGRLPWAVVLLITALACLFVWLGALIVSKTIHGSDFANTQIKQVSALVSAEAVSDGLVYYDGSSVTKLGADAEQKWSCMTGMGVSMNATDAGVAAWSEKKLTLIDGDTGVTSYTGNMDDTVLSARMGEVYTAVVIGQEHNSTIVLMENGGKKIDSITLSDQTVVDYGFFYNGTLFWVMTLDTQGTVPCCTVSTYRPGRRIVGSITDAEQVLYRVMFQSTHIVCTGDTYLKVYDYNGKETEERRKLTYGWFIADADDAADNPMIAMVPSGEYDNSTPMQDVRMIRGEEDQIVRMPYACSDLVADESRVYGFSGGGYVMVAEMGQRHVAAYQLGVQFDTVYGVADGNVAILGQGNMLYFVSLK